MDLGFSERCSARSSTKDGDSEAEEKPAIVEDLNLTVSKIDEEICAWHATFGVGRIGWTGTYFRQHRNLSVKAHFWSEATPTINVLL